MRVPSTILLVVAVAACGKESAPPPKAEPRVSLPEPRTPIAVACPATAGADPRCSLSEDDRLNLRSQVAVEQQRLDDDFVSAWNEQPPLLGRQVWFSLRLRLELMLRKIDVPFGISVDNYRRLASLDDVGLQTKRINLKATREQMARSIINYVEDLRRTLPSAPKPANPPRTEKPPA